MTKHDLKDIKELLSRFNKFMNRISNVYSFITGVDKYELFGEANVALIKSLNDFDNTRSNSFDSYAKYIIADALNEYVRQNKVIISIPRYIARANQIINRIKKLINYNDEMFYLLYSGNIISNNKDVCNELKILKNAAERAKISIEDLVTRAEFLPSVSEEIEILDNEITVDDEQKKLLTKLFVDQVKQNLTKEELLVANYLMDGLNANAISILMNLKYKDITKTITSIRKKILMLLK